jgi:maleylpyruvate isomerase
MLKLYDYFRSSASFRVRIALNLKGLDYETVTIHLLNNGGEQHSSAYKDINPQALVPALLEGNKILTQSLAIIEYLDETHPTPALLPSDPFEKALVRAFALTIAADIHPLNNLRVLNYIKNEFHLSEEQKMQWYKHWIEKGLNALEQQLNVHNLAGDFCFGDQVTLADICLIPQLYNATRFSCDLSHYPTLIRINKNCQRLAAVSDAFPNEPVS